MKKLLSIFVITIAITIAPQLVFAQEDTIETPDEIIINGKHYKAVDETKKESVKKKKSTPLDSSFVVDNNKFQYYNNWLSFGGGVQQNLTYGRTLGFAGGVDLNFHIKKHYLQVGALITGKRFASYNNYQLHLGYARRFEDKDYHFGAAMGVSYSWGFQVEPLDSVKTYNRYYSEPGLYIQGEVIKKVTYDVGLGACLFADWNREQSMMGLRFTLYFSGAYTGKRYKRYDN
ncbi:MAG: hypothetical protein WAQ28_09195 [Bacteroidia bacterium]